MTLSGYDKSEPYWLIRMRQAALQRPRTRFVKIRWTELQQLLRERDALWQAATPSTRKTLLDLQKKDDYGYLGAHELKAWQEWRDQETPSSTPQDD
ncbi:hypothetical protein ACX80U_17685 [Arthrobacter sp. TmT3-37]